MTKNIQREISRNVPRDIPVCISDTTVPLLTAYGCVLMQEDTGKSYTYTAANLKTGKSLVISRRSTPLTTSGVEAMVERIRLSSVAGAGRFEADRQHGDSAAIINCREILNTVFKEVLPQYGYTIRKEQMSLANHILDAISRRQISLAEAEVGIGKTLAYLLPAVIAKRGRLNESWNMSFYPGSQYIDTINMPIVIATSSIALQRALVTDFIPELSSTLLECGIINTPLTAVLRKGREHFVCEQKLRTYIEFERNDEMKKPLSELLMPSELIDMAEIDGLTAHAKRKISVPDRCGKNCPHRETCPYLQYREKAQSTQFDIQVCNHNYLLADVLRRRDENAPLLPDYQMLVIDEAHKFLQAARSMYSVELSSLSAPDITEAADNLNFKRGDAHNLIMKTTKKLISENKRLFRQLIESPAGDDAGLEDAPDRYTAKIDKDAAKHLRNIRDISDALLNVLTSEPTAGKGAGRKVQLLLDLEQMRNQAAILAKHNELICWIEEDNNETRLCAIPKGLDSQLYEDLWNKGVPTILASGTLSAGGGFTRTKKALGIDRVSAPRITETSKSSPFNYRDNSLLYISENVPFPDPKSEEYITAVADEVEKLITASHGHAAVLFTSYKVMDMVWELLSKRGIPFPMFQLGKRSIREIERFKQSGNGVLFAAGAMWEGIDIPGDALSMLIIVKLPFHAPDPISEYERTLYPDMNGFMESVIKPEMLIKYKQGKGRGIRTERDTCVIAVCDIRASSGGAYHECVVAASPDCNVTSDIGEVSYFYERKKPPEYFE